jgi:DNA replication and repair protein RecF
LTRPTQIPSLELPVLSHISLTNFRNYRELELDLGPGSTLIVGDNAQGKTNLLEAIYLLATTRSPRTTRDSDFVNWGAAREPNPITRLAATVENNGSSSVELVIAGRPSARLGGQDQWPGEMGDELSPNGLAVSKRIRVNGIPRRAVDMVGVASAVFFSTADMDVICGAPAMRRRFLDLMISQVDRAYIGALGRYGKVLSQRNALLKSIQDGSADQSELDFWDERLAAEGGVIVAVRAGAMERLLEAACRAHEPIAAGRERLDLRYEPRLGESIASDMLFSVDRATAALRDTLSRQQAREVAAGMTLHGPHRDDLAILIGGAEAAAFGSRAQQRSAALALRLGEAALLSERSGRQPVILLDDILSELDAGRRQAVFDAVCECPQVLITSAEPEHFPASFLSASTTLHVTAGQLSSS